MVRTSAWALKTKQTSTGCLSDPINPPEQFAYLVPTDERLGHHHSPSRSQQLAARNADAARWNRTAPRVMVAPV
jgi:hypothetical protein